MFGNPAQLAHRTLTDSRGREMLEQAETHHRVDTLVSLAQVLHISLFDLDRQSGIVGVLLGDGDHGIGKVACPDLVPMAGQTQKDASTTTREIHHGVAFGDQFEGAIQQLHFAIMLVCLAVLVICSLTLVIIGTGAVCGRF
jgi:hypothetical protein